MINVAMLTPFFTGKLGGPYNVISEITPYLEKKGISSKIFTTSAITKYGKKRTEFFEERTKHLKILRFNSYIRFREYRISFGLLPYLLKKEKKVDIVHSHALRSFQEDIGAFYSFIKKVPLIISPHGGISINWDYGDKIPKMISDKTVGLLKKRLEPHFIAVTKMEIPIIRKLGVKEDHIHFIPHGVNTEIFKPVNSSEIKKKYALEDYDVILYVGRIAKGKGIDKLIKALNLIINQKKKVKLMIIGGDAGFLPTIKKLIQKFNLHNNVIFTGYVPKEGLAKFYSAADIVVYPSRQEIFGLVLVEAGACAKPVIGSDIMGPSEIIVNGETGFTSDFQDIKKLSDLIIELLSNKDLMHQMGKNGLERVKKYYTWEKTANLHLDLYRKVLNLN
ncbi:MAG: glycosyltransferase family 4 protein [Candidatus Thorarchaeota archaeon]